MSLVIGRGVVVVLRFCFYVFTGFDCNFNTYFYYLYFDFDVMLLNFFDFINELSYLRKNVRF